MPAPGNKHQWMVHGRNKLSVIKARDQTVVLELIDHPSRFVPVFFSSSIEASNKPPKQNIRGKG